MLCRVQGLGCCCCWCCWCCWCEYWRVMRCYTRPADTLHTHNTNTSCDYYKCVSTVGHSSCNFLIFTNKTVIICPHHRTQPANPLTLWRGRFQHQGTLGLGLHYQTIFDALSSFHQTSPFSTFQASLHFKLSVDQVTPTPCR